MIETTQSESLRDLIRESRTGEDFASLHWKGTFWDYLRLVEEEPRIVRNAYKRLYDMILDPEHVEGIELYVGSAIPGRFNDSCGAVLVWTR